MFPLLPLVCCCYMLHLKYSKRLQSSHTYLQMLMEFLPKHHICHTYRWVKYWPWHFFQSHPKPHVHEWYTHLSMTLKKICFNTYTFTHPYNKKKFIHSTSIISPITPSSCTTKNEINVHYFLLPHDLLRLPHRCRSSSHHIIILSIPIAKPSTHVIMSNLKSSSFSPHQHPNEPSWHLANGHENPILTTEN